MVTRTMSVVVVLGLTALLVGFPSASAQIASPRGQNIAPVFEGWEKNADGSFSLLFGYYNRNWAERITLPIGPDNSIEPGGPDYGQPTHFYPRRNRFLFKVRVPADFGDKELVWTLTSNSQTERAYGSLLIDYFTDDTVIMNNKGAGGGAGGMYALAGNKPPELRVDGPMTRHVEVEEPLHLTAFTSDDGIPEPRSLPQYSVLLPCDPGQRLRSQAVLVRLPRDGRPRRVRATADLGVGRHARRREFSVVLGMGAAALARRR